MSQTCESSGLGTESEVVFETRREALVIARIQRVVVVPRFRRVFVEVDIVAPNMVMILNS